MQVRSLTADDAQSLLTTWVVSTSLVAFRYAAGFEAQFETPPRTRASHQPPVLMLDLKGEWHHTGIWANDPVPIASEEHERCHQAAFLAFLIGKSVTAISVDPDSTMTLFWTPSYSLTLPGSDSIWEEAWVWFTPYPATGIQERLVCFADGTLQYDRQ